MDSSQLIDRLIATYRTLNHQVRTVDDARTTMGQGGNPSAKDVMRRFRDDEMSFTQALKERISGVPIPDIFGLDSSPTLGMETSADTTAMLIAQFGTARESTLAMLRDLPDAEWDAQTDGEGSIRTRVSELVANDGRQLARLTSMVSG